MRETGSTVNNEGEQSKMRRYNQNGEAEYESKTHGPISEVTFRNLRALRETERAQRYGAQSKLGHEER